MDRRHFLGLLASAAPLGAAHGMLTPWMRGRLRAARYLAGRQSADGAWRSEVYGSFRDGAGLTPLVLRAIGTSHASAAGAAVDWILGHGEACWSIFPVHNAAWLLESVNRFPALSPLADPLAAHLQRLQLGRGRGWADDHPAFGGWSYAGEAAAWRAGLELAPMQQPNLSATVLAVAGLHAAGVSPDDPVMKDAARFIRSCQNFAPAGAGTQFDDGGFFQMGEDISRNKAGKAGIDAAGRLRLRSYYSATADGLRGLLLTGSRADDPRVAAATKWLRSHPEVDDVPDLVFYAAYARAEVGRLLGASLVPRDLEAESMSPMFPGNPHAQERDGSFRNPAGEMRENDPLVATSLAVMAVS